MGLQAKVNSLKKQAADLQKSHSQEDWYKLANDAHSRGMILCADGIERTTEEWLDWLPTYNPIRFSKERMEVLREELRLVLEDDDGGPE